MIVILTKLGIKGTAFIFGRLLTKNLIVIIICKQVTLEAFSLQTQDKDAYSMGSQHTALGV